MLYRATAHQETLVHTVTVTSPGILILMEVAIPIHTGLETLVWYLQWSSWTIKLIVVDSYENDGTTRKEGTAEKIKDKLTGRDNDGSHNTGSDSYGSGNTGSDSYGTGNTGSDSYGSGTGIGNNKNAFTDQPIGSTNDSDAFANKRADGSRTIDDFTSGTGGSNYDSSNTRSGDYDSSNTRSGLGDNNYGSSNTRSGDNYKSTTQGGDYDSSKGERKEGFVEKIKDKVGLNKNKEDKYDNDNSNY